MEKLSVIHIELCRLYLYRIVNVHHGETCHLIIREIVESKSP